jgi:uncharacterized repeat protein (TIGR01451 family)
MSTRAGDALQPEADQSARRTVIIAVLIVAFVALGYAVVLFVAGTALQNAPGARQILGVRNRLDEILKFQPPQAPLPPLQAQGVGVVAQTPSPVQVRPAPTLSPLFKPPQADAPSTVTFSIQYENTTGVQLTNVQISDKLPTGTTFKSANPAAAFDGTQLVWSLGTLAPGASGTVSFVVTTTRHGKITNTGVMTSTEAPAATITSSANVP